MTQTSTNGKLIHIGQYILPQKRRRMVLLRQKDPSYYAWYERNDDGAERELQVGGPNVQEAMRLAHKNWKSLYFQTYNCGFRYSLPERDEHGSNALFDQMVASYSSMNGVYFDQSVGHNCFVQAASQEALDLWHQLKTEGKLAAP